MFQLPVFIPPGGIIETSNGKKDYSKLSKEELLKLIGKQDEDLKNIKYRLIWDSEKEPEKVIFDCENNIPILQRVKDKEIKTDEGVIPKLFYFEDNHDKNWFRQFDIEYNYGLKWNQIRKLEREGVPRPRNLINSEGHNYCSVSLLKENKEFFKTHQKIRKTYPEIIVCGDNGEEITL